MDTFEGVTYLKEGGEKSLAFFKEGEKSLPSSKKAQHVLLTSKKGKKGGGMGEETCCSA